jgi:HNH endonuclease
MSPATEFKPGRVEPRRCLTGVVSVRRTKGNKLRAFIKVAQPNIWCLRAVLVWELANGPVPSGMLVHHADRNTLNDSLDNLVLESRASHINEHRLELEAGKLKRSA